MATNAARSFRLAGVTSSQLDDLAAFWGESTTAALGRAIDREWNRTIYAGPIMPPTQAPPDDDDEEDNYHCQVAP